MQSHPQHNRTLYPLSLPPELWIWIFRYATDVPGTLIPDIYAYSSSVGSDPYIKKCHANLRNALITKRTLVCVCKQWWYLAIPFLYESVYVGRKRCLRLLSQTLADSATGKGTLVSRRPLGEYTQRLDATVHGTRGSDNPEAGYFTTIIEHMPHLAIAVYIAPPNPYNSSNQVSNSILKAHHQFAPSLRVFDWHANPYIPSDFRLIPFLAKCTQLRILHYHDLIWSKALEPDGIPATVTTLRMQCARPHSPLGILLADSNLNIAQRLRCPALRELVLDIYPLFTQWQDIFRLYGPQLDSAHFYVYTHIERPMKLLGETSPGLRRLILSSEFHVGPRVNFVLPSVTYLGLAIALWQSTTPNFERFFVALERLTSNMPSLNVVQLLEEDDVRCLLESHAAFAVSALQPYETARFRIEDNEGVLLTGRRSSASLWVYSD